MEDRAENQNDDRPADSQVDTSDPAAAEASATAAVIVTAIFDVFA
jgi:hypothetical protein